MSIFSNYPGDPPDEGRDPIPEEESILFELEGFMPQPNIDRVMEIVAGLVDQINRECPVCMAEGERQEAECQKSGEEWERTRGL